MRANRIAGEINRQRRTSTTRLALLLSLLALGALTLAACGGDGDDDETLASSEATATSEAAAGTGGEPVALEPENRTSDEVIITTTGDAWAAQFAKGGCRYMGQPACERAACERVGATEPIRNCTPLSSGLRRSFADATVERVDVVGRYAEAKFSNGVSVEFEGKMADEGDRQPVGEYWSRFWFPTERWVKRIGRAADYKSCGGLTRFSRGHSTHPTVMVEVVEGDVPCGAARRVLLDLYLGREDDLVYSEYRGQFALVGPWRCWGLEANKVCKKRTRAPSARTIRAHFPRKFKFRNG